jgi:CHAT domain-containing protein
MQYEGRWLIERAAISYIANLSSLQLPFRPLKDRRVLIVGVEDFEVPGRTLAALPEAELEAHEVKKHYDSHGVSTTVLLGREATVDRLQSCALEKYSCLHFATHGENVNSDNPMESHFYMQNSLLDGLELANLQLRAETVVLSACSSGQRAISGRGIAELPGDDLFGLQAAFFRAGAHRVLATLWPVDSLAARKITAGFHARLAGGGLCDAELALQGAVCDYLKQAGIQARKIYYWAPFFLSVLGRAKRN